MIQESSGTTSTGIFHKGNCIVAQKLIGNSAVYTLGNLLPQAMNILLLPIFTRYLSPAEFGIFSYTTAVCSFLALLGALSIQSYVLRHYFNCRSEEEKSRLFGTIFGFLVVYNVVLLGIEFLILPGLFRLLNAQVPFEPYMRLALLSNTIEIIGIIPLAYFRVNEQAKQFITLTFSQSILNAGLSYYLVAVVGTGILGRYYGVLGTNVILLVVYLVIICRVSSWTLDLSRIKEAITFSLPLTGAGALAWVTMMSDRILLERFVSLDQLGIYSVGMAIAFGLHSLSNGIYKAVEPLVYRLAAESILDAQILWMKSYMVLLLIGLGSVMIVFSREIVTLLTGPSFYESYKIVVLLIPAVVLRGVSIPVATYAVAVGKTRYALLANLAGAGTSLCINLILLPILGIYGATISSIIAWLVIIYVYKVGTEKKGQVRWNFERDLLFIVFAFGLSSIILQIETSRMLVSMVVKAILVGGAMVFFAWWQLNLRRPTVA